MTLIEVLNSIEVESRTKMWAASGPEVRIKVMADCIGSWDELSDEQCDSITAALIGAPPEPVAVKKVRKARIKKIKAPEKPLTQHSTSEDRIPF